MSLAVLFHFLCAQHVSDINIPIIRSLWLFCWITTLAVLFLVRCVLEFWCGWVVVVSMLQAEACTTDTTESLTLHPKLQLGEEEKVTGGQIGWVWGMGITVMLFLAKNCETLKDLWACTLSWWIMMFWFCHFCGILRRTFSRKLLRTSQ